MRNAKNPTPEAPIPKPSPEPSPAGHGTSGQETASAAEGGAGAPPSADARGPAASEAIALPESIVREIEQLRAQAAELVGLRQKAKERDEFLALAQRVQADFINYQKRMASEKEQWGKFLHADLIRDLIPALDALDICASAASRGGDPNAHLEGYRIAIQEFRRILEKNGLQIVAPTGGVFDPAAHEAVGFKETADAPEQTVAELVRKGYRLHDRVLRPAQILLARKPAPADGNGPDDCRDGMERDGMDETPPGGVTPPPEC